MVHSEDVLDTQMNGIVDNLFGRESKICKDTFI